MIFFSTGDLEANEAPLSLVYQYFGELYKHFEVDLRIQEQIKARWDFLLSECTGIAYMLNPKFAADGFFVDNDRVDIINYVKKFVFARHPELAEKAEEEIIQFVSKIASLPDNQKEKILKFDTKSYWNVIGRHEFPVAYLCAKEVNEMICSSAASERVWSIYRLIHSRLRNRLTNEKVEKLAFIYVNSAILDKNDQFDYVLDVGAILTGSDYQDD